MTTRSRSRAVNVITVILLEAGLLFGVGYLIGLWLFVTSDAWSMGKKVLGIAIVPGGAIAGYFLMLSVGSRSSINECVRGADLVAQTCSAAQFGSSSPAVAFVLLILAVVAPLGIALGLFLDLAKSNASRKSDESLTRIVQ